MSKKYNVFVQKILDNKNKYIIFYSKWCGPSQNAIKLLKEKNVCFKGYIIDKIDNGISELLNNLKEHSNLIHFKKTHKTRPLIFKNGKFIGGYDNLAEHFLNK